MLSQGVRRAGSKNACVYNDVTAFGGYHIAPAWNGWKDINGAGRGVHWIPFVCDAFLAPLYLRVGLESLETAFIS